MSAQPDIAVIILAAGRGRRLGADKATLPWGRHSLIEHVLGQFTHPRITTRCIVTNPANHATIATRVPVDTLLTQNPDPHTEMIASVRHGVRASEAAQPAAFCIHPVDIFAVSHDLLTMLFAAQHARPDAIHLPTVSGRGAHPIIIPAQTITQINQLPPGVGLNHLLNGDQTPVLRHPWPDDRLLADIDTPADYRRHCPPGSPASESPSDARHDS